MGNNASVDTAPIIALETARQHVSEEEYQRIRTAFNRFKNNCLNIDEFSYHVLGGASIPEEHRRTLFRFFSRGEDTLSFDNLFCALVGICRIELVQSMFIEDFRQFSSWGLRPPMLTLPMNDVYISFYEVMSYVTHLSVEEVMELEKVFATISDRTSCKVTKSTWNDCLSGCYPVKFADRLFAVFDENGDGQIDFRELVCGLSALCRGPFPSRLSFLAKLWDDDGDEQLCDKELMQLYEDLQVESEFQTIVKSSDSNAAPADFATWALTNEYARRYYDMCSEIGHICMGLRPESAQLENAIVCNFEKRCGGVDLAVWNIVSSKWHQDWMETTSQGKNAPPIDNQPISFGSSEWSAKVACLSSECAILKPGIQEGQYVAVPVMLWKAFLRWHGSLVSMDGQFTRKYLTAEYFDSGDAGLELYPLDVLFMAHEKIIGQEEVEGTQTMKAWTCAQVSRSMKTDELLNMCITELKLTPGGARLWLLSLSNSNSKEDILLDEGDLTLHQLGCKPNKLVKLLIEIRDGSGVWPEEARASATGKQITSIYSSTHSARPFAVGLVNSLNYCYRNTAVQCLARVLPLTEYLLKEESITDIKRGCSDTKSLKTLLEYSNILAEFFSGKKKNLAPIEFNNAVDGNSDLFDDGRQHDCQEFVAFLLEQFHKCMHLSSAGNEVVKTEVPLGLSEEDRAQVEWTNYLQREQSLITRLFNGQLRSQLVCRACGSRSIVYEPYASVSLPIGFNHIHLFHIIVIRRDGSTPRRYGFRLSRESPCIELKRMVAVAASIDCNSISIQCLSSRGAVIEKIGRGVHWDESTPLRMFPTGHRMFAMEIPSDGSSFRVAAHRKLQYNSEPYLLGSTGGCVVTRFGLPLVLPCPEKISGRDLYEDVMQQMGRFMDVHQPTFSSRAMDPCEDASSGYPFSLSIVNESWEWCGHCPALSFCRGCPITPDNPLPFIPVKCAISVDWFPISLYLKYNHSQELACEDDKSVEETWLQHEAPSSLDDCLRKFSCAELLEEPMHCDGCVQKTMKEKIISIYRLPKYLIIHLKRFEYIREENVMGKCKRIINFPLNDFDPTPFVDGPHEGKYDCIAIANHYGQLSSGHFISYARGREDKWLMLNDSSVKEVLEDAIDKRTAYLLFYERKS